MDGSWNALSYNYIVDPTYQCIGMEAGSSHYSMEVTAADVAAIQASGLVVSVCWLTVTKVSIK